MNIQVIRATETQRGIIAKLLQEYLRHLSTFKKVERDENGTFVYPYLDLYWKEADRIPLLIQVDGSIAGFALIREQKAECTIPYMSIAEFYVIPSCQRKGVGEKAFSLLLDLYRGDWQLSVIRKNLTGVMFWRKVLKAYAADGLEEQESADSVQFHFSVQKW